MGNYRFKLSDMIPNAWFSRLKDMGKSRNQKYEKSISPSSSSSNIATPALSAKTVEQPYQRKSYHFTRDLLSSIPIDPLPPAANDHHDHTLDDHSASQTRSSPKPRKSSKNKRRNNNIRATSSSSNNHTNCCNSRSSIPTVYYCAGCSCRGTMESISKPDSCTTTPEGSPNSPLLTSSSDNQSLHHVHPPPPTHPNHNTATAVSHQLLLHLPPIITNPAASRTNIMNERTCSFRRSQFQGTNDHLYGCLSVKAVKGDILTTSTSNTTDKTCISNPEQKKTRTTTTTPAAAARRFTTSCASSPGAGAGAPTGGLKLRTNSPRIGNRRIARKSISSSRRGRGRSRRSVSAESFAVVKSSEDPQRDFRESMVEMIVENNICASTELEDLLACYLSLNSDRYHDLIIRVFKQIWFDIFVDLHPISLQ